MDAYQTFNSRFPCPEKHYLAMLEEAAQYLRDSCLKANGYTRPKAETTEQAASYLFIWANSAGEYDTSDLAAFVATHRRPCVWAVLVGKSSIGRKENL